MGTDATWNAETEQVWPGAPLIRGRRATAARWGARLCLSCGERRALFFYRGVVKADRDHTLCFECYRAEVNRVRARRLGATARSVVPASPRPRPSRMLGDRAALHGDLAARRRRAQIMARHALERADTVRPDAALAS